MCVCERESVCVCVCVCVCVRERERERGGEEGKRVALHPRCVKLERWSKGEKCVR